MIYKLELKIKQEKENIEYLYIDAEDVSQREMYFDNDYYNTFMPDDIYFNDLKMYKRIPIDPEPTFYNDYQFWAGRTPKRTLSYPVTEKFKKVLEQFNLVGSRFYSGDLNFQGKKIPFFVFHILDGEWFQHINRDKTIFCKWNSYLDKYFLDTAMPIESFKQFEEIDQELKRKDLEDDVDAEECKQLGIGEIHLKKEYDLILIPKLHICVSERLKNAIEEAGLTGIEFKPIENVDFYCNGKKL